MMGMLDRASILFRMERLKALSAALGNAKPCPKQSHGYEFLTICGDCESIHCDRCPGSYCQCQNDE
jgi:hypothetical protein